MNESVEKLAVRVDTLTKRVEALEKKNIWGTERIPENLEPDKLASDLKNIITDEILKLEKKRLKIWQEKVKSI